MRYNHSDIKKKEMKKMIDRMGILNERNMILKQTEGEEIILSEEELGKFFEKTDESKIAEMGTEYYMSWGDSLRCEIIYDFETHALERVVGSESWPHSHCVSLYTLYPRWTHELALTDLLDDDEIEKFRWYVAGREFEEAVKSYSINDYDCDAVRDIQKIKDFIDLLSEVGQVESFETRVYNLIEFRLIG